MKLAHDNHRGFLWIKRKIEFEEGQRLRNLNLDWINIERESQRHYPNGTLAAHLLGGVDFEETRQRRHREGAGTRTARGSRARCGC